MYYTLVVKIYQSFEDLAYVHGYQILWELSEPFADSVQGPILAESKESNTRKDFESVKHNAL
jgi:hypothetical protein